MRIAGHNVRTSKNYVTKVINNEVYAFYPSNWSVDMSKVRYVSQKALLGKIDIPQKTGTYNILFVTEDGKLSLHEDK